jgi:hypothetical protein
MKEGNKYNSNSKINNNNNSNTNAHQNIDFKVRNLISTYTNPPFRTHGAPHRKVWLQQLAVFPTLRKENKQNKAKIAKQENLSQQFS